MKKRAYASKNFDSPAWKTGQTRDSLVQYSRARCSLRHHGWRAKRRWAPAEYLRVSRGVTHAAVRWNTCSRCTFGAISGQYWIALPPVPIDATRRPSSA